MSRSCLFQHISIISGNAILDTACFKIHWANTVDDNKWGFTWSSFSFSQCWCCSSLTGHHFSCWPPRSVSAPSGWTVIRAQSHIPGASLSSLPHLRCPFPSLLKWVPFETAAVAWSHPRSSFRTPPGSSLASNSLSITHLLHLTFCLDWDGSNRQKRWDFILHINIRNHQELLKSSLNIPSFTSSSKVIHSLPL